MKRNLFSLLTLLALEPLAIPALSHAAEPGRHLNEQMPTPPDFLPAHPADPFQLPPVTVPESPAPGGVKRFAVERVEFSGNASIASAELEALAAPYRGRELGEMEVEELRRKLTRHYIARGYINSGALAAGFDAGSRTLRFEIVEGRLSGLRVTGLERLRESYVSERLNRNPEAPLNIDVLRERFQLLLADPLIAQANARLIPGERPGEAFLDVDVKRARPYGLGLFYNNYQPPSIGAYAGRVAGWVRNLTGWGDLLNLSYQQPVGNAPGDKNSVDWHLPVNSRGGEVWVQVDHGRSAVVEESMRQLDITSRLDNVEAGIAQPVFESLRDKFTVGASWSRRDSRSYLGGEPFSFVYGDPAGHIVDRGWRGWMEYAHRSETQILVVRATHSELHNNLSFDPNTPVVSEHPDQRYAVRLFQAQYNHQIARDGTQVVLRGTWQQTGSKLLTLDGMAIGGVNSVRGFRENELIRDKGRMFNLELHYPFYRDASSGLAVSLQPFYDYGRGKNQGASATTLSSIGLATQLAWQGVQFNLAVAKRLAHTASTADSGDSGMQDQGIHFQVSYNFFP